MVGGGSGVLSALLHYAALRLPQLASLVVPLAVLIAAMATFAQLVVSHEIVALRALGVSIYRRAGALLLGATVVGGGHFWLDDRVLPVTVGRLRLCADSAYHVLPPAATPPTAPTQHRTTPG